MRSICRHHGLPAWACAMANEPESYWCTEPLGHDGDHVAKDSHGVVCATWPRAEGMIVLGLGEAHETRRQALCLEMSTDGRWWCTLPEGHGPVHQSHAPGGAMQAEWMT